MIEFDCKIIIEYIPLILEGIKLTVFISVISSIIAFIIGIIIVFIRSYEKSFLGFIAASWVEITRNTPLLVQLYILYKGLPSIGIVFSDINCGIIALSVYTGAYISEVLRSGVNSIEKEQIQASKALSLNRIQTFRFIILPQAIRIVIPPLSSQFVNLVKNSSLVSFIAVTDLFYAISYSAEDTYMFAEFFVIGVALYMILTGIIATIGNWAEKRFKIKGAAASV